MRRAFPLIVLGLAGCSSGSTDASPSLLPRPIEQRSDADPVTAAPVATLDPALDVRIAAALQRVNAAAAAFDKAAAGAAGRVAAARGRPKGSDAWLDAQVALGALDAPRADTSAAATDLTQIAIDRGTTGEPEYPALTAAERQVAAVRDAQGARIAELTAALAR